MNEQDKARCESIHKFAKQDSLCYANSRQKVARFCRANTFSEMEFTKQIKTDFTRQSVLQHEAIPNPCV